jgi:hypothetical protein
MQDPMSVSSSRAGTATTARSRVIRRPPAAAGRLVVARRGAGGDLTQRAP